MEPVNGVFVREAATQTAAYNKATPSGNGCDAFTVHGVPGGHPANQNAPSSEPSGDQLTAGLTRLM